MHGLTAAATIGRPISAKFEAEDGKLQATAFSKAVAGNVGFHAVSVFPSLKDGHPVAEISLHKGGEWKTVVEKLD
jgi:hypothetical protein